MAETLRELSAVGLNRPDRLVALLISALFAVPVAAGLAGVVLPAFGYLPALGGHALSLDPFRDLLAVPGLWRSAASSVRIGLGATALALAAAFMLLASLLGTRALRLVRQALAPLLAVPHAAAALGFAFLIAPSGPLARVLALSLDWNTPPDLLIVNDPLGLAMIAGLAAKELPFLLLVSFAALPETDGERHLAVARSLGCGRIAGFSFAVWPTLYRRIRLPVLAVAAYSSSVVDVAIILGPQTPPPLAVRLTGWMSDPDLSLRFRACAGAILQLAVTGLVLLVWIVAERTASLVLRRLAEAGTRMRRDRLLRLAFAVPAAGACLAIGGGLVVLLLWSLAASWFFPSLLPASWTLRAWQAGLSSVADPLRTTLALALASATLSLFLAVAALSARRSRAFAALLYLPLVVPAVCFVQGLQAAQLQFGLPPNLVTVAAAHIVFVLPYAVLSLEGPWTRLDPRFERVARSLGASPLRTFLGVRLALLTPALLASFAIGFAVSVGQYLPTLLLGQGRVPTITTEAVALGAGGNRRLIGVVALLQVVLPTLVFALAALVPTLLARRRRAMRL